MDHAQITQVLDSLPAGALSQHRFVRHYFYGPDSRLRRVRTHLKRLQDDMIFDFLDKGLAVTTAARLDHDGLARSVGMMESAAAEAGLEYDGFEIVLDDVEEQVTLEPLEDHVAPGSYLRLALGAGRFGYLLFLGGNKNDGYLFDCLALVDDGTATPGVLAGAPQAIEIGDRRQAIGHAVSLAGQGDIVLVAGKGHEQGQIIGRGAGWVERRWGCGGVVV